MNAQYTTAAPPTMSFTEGALVEVDDEIFIVVTDLTDLLRFASASPILWDGTRCAAYEAVELHNGSFAHCLDVARVESRRIRNQHVVGTYLAHEVDQMVEDGDIIECAFGTLYPSCEVGTTVDDEIYHIDDLVEVWGCFYHQDDDRLSTDGYGNNIVVEDGGCRGYCYCDDGEWWPYHECHYCDRSGYVHCEEDECGECGCNNQIRDYHKGAKPELFRGISPWLVGFEVEKNNVCGAEDVGDEVEETSLFACWERDSSCGVEGVTHAYDPCDPAMIALFTKHLGEAEDHVNSASDSSCGGHVNISNCLMSSGDLRDKFRNFAGLWFAMFRHRLLNDYCRNDKQLRGGGGKYSVVNVKNFGIEIRLPRRVQNATVLANRFRLAGLTATAIDQGMSFSRYAHSCKELLLSAYNGDRRKLAKVLRMARHFQRWLDTDGEECHSSISRYVG